MNYRLGLVAALLLVLSAPIAANGQSFKTAKHTVVVETVAANLKNPWSLAFLPDGSMLVTERSGQLRHVSGGKVSQPVTGMPQVWAERQGGLLDILVDPEFSSNQTIFFSFSEPAVSGNDVAGTAVARARLVMGPQPRLADVKVIFRQNKKTRSGVHFGSRLVQSPDGKLFVTIGERGDRPRAQDPFDHAGSVLRINRDGTAPRDNPFADGKKGQPEIWSIGHRNPQGAIWHPETNSLWTVEHGARGGDEINRPLSGRNYGWPVISYGRHYSGFKIGQGQIKEGMEQPVHFWDPSIAPSGFAYYGGDKFPNWKGNLFVGALAGRALSRLEMKDHKVVREERLFQGEFGRIRDVRQGPDGFIYFITDQSNGRILRLKPS